MSELVMPRLSDTMEEGTILRWLKRNGDTVRRGEELAEIETDKATMTYESDQEGVLEIIAAEGTTLPVGAPIARLGAEGEEAAQAGGAVTQAAGAPSAEGSAPSAATSQSVATAGPGAAPVQAGETAPQSAAAASQDGASAAQPVSAAPGSGERVRASPLARRIAHENGVDLVSLSGSGPGGRIVKADVLATGAVASTAPTQAGAPAAAASAPSASASSPAAASAETPPVATPDAVATAKGTTTDIELTRTQQTIARRMAESKATIPDFALRIDVDMEDCVKLRGELKGISHGDGQAAPTYNDMVVKACALALREHERANASYRDGRIQLHSRVNVGVAVAADDALVVPTVFDADEKSLGEIAREARALAERVRSQAITPPELGGGTFTVSNLGMYGIASFTPIINPPQAAILSVGALEQRAVVRDGEVLARATMTLTLVCDHRILYGAEAAQFLARVRELLQTPSALTL